MKYHALLILIFIRTGLFAQDHLDDFAVVQEILDSNNVKKVTIVQITKVDSERITWLDLRNRDPAKDFITNVPEAIGRLNKLKYLRLSYNRLTELPESIGKLADLEILILRGNNFTNLPVSMGNLSKLKKLDLRNNELSEIPEFLTQLITLTHLNLRGNKLLSLPEGLSAQ
jgi:Leucine-rich repeat (LRR) protein